MSVSISIKSEIDSRVVLYPIMRCLKPLGNILIVTSNKIVSRLIDGEYEGDFRNFHIMIDETGATDELLEDAGINTDDYTFVVYDNVGVLEQDKLLIPIGPIVSEVFNSEMLYLGEDRNTHIIRFGTPIKQKVAPKKKTKEEIKAEKEAKKKSKSTPEVSEDELDDLVKSKFQPKKKDVLEELKKLPSMQFPKFDDIELFESYHKFYNIDKNFIKFFYTVFKDYITVKEPYFIREVTKPDASGNGVQ